MTLGTLREAMIGGMMIRTQADAEAKHTPAGIDIEVNMSGNGTPVPTGTVVGGSVTVPALLFIEEIIRLRQKVNETPDELWPCSVTTMDGTVYGFTGTVTGGLEHNMKDGKVDLTFSAVDFGRL